MHRPLSISILHHAIPVFVLLYFVQIGIFYFSSFLVGQIYILVYAITYVLLLALLLFTLTMMFFAWRSYKKLAP